MAQSHWDVIIIGAGASGLFCAAEAGARGKRVLLLDHAVKLAEKIRISGGGRCNFTNLFTNPERFLSLNRHFCRSALARFDPKQFIERVEAAQIAYHEKTQGQLFCDNSSQDIISLLTEACKSNHVVCLHPVIIQNIQFIEGKYCLLDNQQLEYQAEKLVIATGGLSIPQIGASAFGYEVAKQFGLNVVEPKPGLVPLTFAPEDLAWFGDLSGISLRVRVNVGKQSFQDDMLLTHKGLSGPAILQISSYWKQGEFLIINLLPDLPLFDLLIEAKKENVLIENVLARFLAKRLATAFLARQNLLQKRVSELSDKILRELAEGIQAWKIRPSGTQGYKKAEVTLGGVDTAELSSKNLESKKQPGLYFIGEVIDVTGHLGGFNFQWAWASAWVVAQDI